MLVTMQGTWTLTVKAKYAAFPQRFIISGATSGNGTYLANEKMAPVTVSGKQWTIAIQNDAGQGFQLSDTRIKFPVKNGNNYQFDIESNDAGNDKDFNDLILTCSTPVAINDFIIYGNATTYKGRCFFNPCNRNIFIIDTYAGLLEALKNDYLKKIIAQLYPERIPPVITGPNPPDPAPYFKPIVINLEEDLQPSKVQLLYRNTTDKTTASVASKDKQDDTQNPLAATNFDLVKSLQTNIATKVNPALAIDKVALASQLDKLRLVCTTAPASYITLSFEEYDRTLSEKLGGVHTGNGNRQLLGDTITDANGNYIFRFTFSVLDQLFESINDIAPGENITVVRLPDIIVKVKDTQAPFNVLYESAPYYNIPTLKRIDLCLPQSKIPVTYQCFNGNMIGSLGNVFVGGNQNTTAQTTGAALDRNGYNNHLNPDGKISVHNTTAGFAIDCASWSGLVDMKGCLFNTKRKPTDPIISFYTIRVKREGAADWSFVNQPYLHPLFSKRNLPGYSGDPVGPFAHNIVVDGTPIANAPTYKNIQKEIFFDGIDWEFSNMDRYMQLSTDLYDIETGDHNPGTFFVRIDGFDNNGAHVPGATDLVALYIDNKQLNFGLSDLGFTSVVEYIACGLYRLSPAQMNTPISFKFKASDSEGFVDSYSMTVSKCPSNITLDFDLPAAHPSVSSGTLASGSSAANTDAAGCPGYTGTLHDFGTGDFVTMQIHPAASEGGWLHADEQYATYYFALSAYKRTTNGYNTGLSGQYYAATSFAVERKP